MWSVKTGARLKRELFLQPSQRIWLNPQVKARHLFCRWIKKGLQIHPSLVHFLTLVRVIAPPTFMKTWYTSLFVHLHSPFAASAKRWCTSHQNPHVGEAQALQTVLKTV